MKRSDENVVVHATFIVENSDAAVHVVSEICDLATNRGLNLLSTWSDSPTSDEMASAEELEVFDEGA